MFGIKDIFTTINLMGGVAAVCLCINGDPYAAGLAVMIGYVAGDTVDGWIARKLNSANQFGAEYDTIADHMSHIIAPAAIVYTVYADAGLLPAPFDMILAMALAGSIIAAASIRHARNIVVPVSFRGIWGGLPRSVLGFMAMSYANAALAPYLPGGMWLGVALIPLMAAATLTRWPFANHHLGRKHFLHVRLLVLSFFIVTPITVVVAPAFLYDVIFFFMLGYSLTAWMGLTPNERSAYREAVRTAREAAA